MKQNVYRYYSTQRPVSPGTFPNHDVVDIHNFNSRVPCADIGRHAWGYIDYSVILDEKEAANYELLLKTE